MLADKFGLIYVSTEDLLTNLSKTQPELGKVISSCQEEGNQIPDHIICSLIEQRLKKPDCQVNGWVMEGFPETEAQCNLLKAMKITPSMVFIFEQYEEESIAKLSKRRVDPKTGLVYNLDLIRCTDQKML
jgi:adenylate kinase